MANTKFSEFDNTTAVSLSGQVVGLLGVGPTANKRWTFDAVRVWLQGVLDIVRLSRATGNYLDVTGNALDPGTVVAQAAGVGTDIGIEIRPKAAGEVRLYGGSVIVSASTTLEATGGIVGGAGGLAMGVGNISLTTGNITLGTGSITLSGGNAVFTGASSVLVNGTGNVAVANGYVSAPDVITDVITSFGGGLLVDDDLAIQGNIVTSAVTISAPAATLTVSAISSTNATFVNVIVNGSLSGTGGLTIPSASIGSATVTTELNVTGRIYLDRQELTAQAAQLGVVIDGIVADVTTVGTPLFGVTLPNVGGAFPPDGDFRIVYNNGANNMSVWPYTSATINGMAANAPLIVPAGSAYLFSSLGTIVTGNWVAIRLGGDYGYSTMQYREISGADAFGVDDYTINADGTFDVDLPTAVGITGKVYVLKNSGAGTVTIVPDGAETIDGAANLAVLTGDAAMVQSTGAGWIII